MSVIIGMAVYSTEENKKDECLEKTLRHLFDTVDLDKHKLILSVNSATKETRRIVGHAQHLFNNISVVFNNENIGTAEAINKAWRERMPGQHCIKMDDDIVIHNPGWVEMMIECIERDPNIGIVGLKRKDCWENVNHPDPYYRSELIQLPQTPGQRWLNIEKVNHVIGTCQMYNSNLLDKIGYLYQPSLYGYDDVLASWRCYVAGFKSVFLPQIEIDHIDPGNTEYQGWKERHSGEQTQNVIKIKDQYLSGERSIYYNPYEA